MSFVLRRPLHSSRHLKFHRSSTSMLELNPRVIKAEYAVRGLIPTRAEELRQILDKEPEKVSFKRIINANIGNPQQLKQKPLTFYRSVLSILQNPNLLNHKELYPADVYRRAQTLLDAIGSVGAYSHSQGIAHLRNSVANFISERDGQPADPNHIYLTGGASDGVKNIFQILLTGSPQDGVLIPIPQYPLYTAELCLKNATPIPYYLKEESGWSIDIKEIEQLITDSRKFSLKPKILVVINPGNPTGAILSRKEIEEILKIGARENIVVIADEVYQENVFQGEFISFKKVLLELQNANPGQYDNAKLASLHSISKGVSGECGQRGGYLELHGFDEEVLKLFTKIASIALCPVVTGQALVEMMVNPPKKGDESFESDQEERRLLHKAYKTKAELLYKAFSELDNIDAQKPQGAMYLFPRLYFNETILKKAEEENLKPDVFYCLELLEATGICCVPGSGFGQVPGTYHVRTTFLPEGEEWIQEWAKFHKEFFEKYK